MVRKWYHRGLLIYCIGEGWGRYHSLRCDIYFILGYSSRGMIKYKMQTHKMFLILLLLTFLLLRTWQSTYSLLLQKYAKYHTNNMKFNFYDIYRYMPHRVRHQDNYISIYTLFWKTNQESGPANGSNPLFLYWTNQRYSYTK